MPGTANLGSTPAIDYGRCLPSTFGQNKVPFLHAQPSAALIPGITAPKIENAASVEITQWPKALRDLAAQLGAAAGRMTE